MSAIFLSFFDYYRDTAKAWSRLDGSPLGDPFGFNKGSFRYREIWSRIEALHKAKIEEARAGTCTLSERGFQHKSMVIVRNVIDVLQTAAFGRAAGCHGDGHGDGSAGGQGGDRRYRRDVPVVVRKVGGSRHSFEVRGPRGENL